MSTLGRHFCIDFYGCQIDCLRNPQLIESLLLLAAGELGLILSEPVIHNGPDDRVLGAIFIDDGRLTMTTFPQLGYAAIDIFCIGTNPSPQKALAVIKKMLMPEKVRTTSVRRGDFGSERDMKPKTRTKAGPMRRIKETGNKMLSAFKKPRPKH